MDRITRFLWSLASLVFVGVLWWIGAAEYPSAIPGIGETATALVDVVTTPGPYGQPFYFHVFKTAEMIFTSLAIALVVGTVVGVALGTNEWLEEVASAWIYALLAVPSLVIVFVAAIWLGFSVWAGYFAVPFVITPFIVLNMWEGARNLDSQLAEMADFFGVNRYQRFTEVIVPQLIPFLFASVRSALSIGWKITLLVEAFLLSRGVGFMFRRYFDQYDLTMMMSWLIIFTVFLIIVEYGILAPLHKRITHWRPEVDGVIATE